jgi:hypothetical protein
MYMWTDDLSYMTSTELGRFGLQIFKLKCYRVWGWHFTINCFRRLFDVESNLYCNRVSEGCTVAMTKPGHLQNHQCLPATEGTERTDTFKFSMYQQRGLCHDLISRNTWDELTFNNDNSKSNSKSYVIGEMRLHVPTMGITDHGPPFYAVHMYIYVYTKWCCILQNCVIICK